MKHVIGEIYESQFEYVDFIRHPHGDIKYVTEFVSLEYRQRSDERYKFDTFQPINDI